MYHYQAEEKRVLRLLRGISKNPKAVRLITAHHYSRYKRMVERYGLWWSVSNFRSEYPELVAIRQPNTGSATKIGFWSRAAQTVARDWGWVRRRANNSRLLPKKYWNPTWQPEGVRREVKKPRLQSAGVDGDANGDVAQMALDTLLAGLQAGKLRLVRVP